MIKKIIKFFFYTSIVLILFVAYLSFYGIKTDKFNSKIKNEVLKLNKEINLDLKPLKILLDIKDLTLKIKTLRPSIIFNNQKLPLQEIETSISIRSFLANEFSINNLSISTEEIQIKDIISISKSFKNSPELYLLDKFVEDGVAIGKIDLNFEENGNIKKNYEIKGFIKNAKLSLLKKNKIENLNLSFKVKNKEYQFEKIQSDFNQVKLFLPFIKIKEKQNLFSIEGKVLTDEKFNDIHKLNNLFNNLFNVLNIKKINFSSESDFRFNISRKLKIDNFILKSEININNLIYKNNSLNIKGYLPNFKDTIELQDNKVFIEYKNNELKINGNGKISIEDKIDDLKYELLKKKDSYDFKTVIDINKNSLFLKILDYTKNKDLNSVLSINGSFKKNKNIILSSISFTDQNKNFFKIKGLNLNDKYKINSLNFLNFNFINNNNIKNQFNLKKIKNKYEVYGKSFDATKIINKVFDSNDEDSQSIFNNLNSSFDIKIEKTYIDELNFVNNLISNIDYKNNQIHKLSLKSIFPNNKKLSLSIKTNKNNEKITKFFTDYPRPLIKRYKFINGFEDGFLEFSSVKKNDTSRSHLIIDDFKIQEVPVLAKLLSLASLQGIADILTGEGIRFNDFEMKFSKKKSLMTIDEMYAIGPAISILMDGYIESKKLISLRGTLVPATTINRSIASIPILGGILVGEKTGEGVFGVSFKVKGPPNNLRTIVNPVKTLTPRFITRTLEKIKNN